MTYDEGRQAFMDQGAKAKCPYASRPRHSSRRSAWWRGFLDARTDSRLEKVFRNLNTTTMYQDHLSKRS